MNALETSNATMGSDTKSAPVERELMSIDAAAIKLDVCKKTVGRLIEDGELGPKVKVRSSAKLFVSNVNAYIEKIKKLGIKKLAERSQPA
jgi:prefoldin subunit 5